jgi:WD40 repeat protein
MIGLSVALSAQQRDGKEPISHLYNAAVYRSGGAFTGNQQLIVFPIVGKEFSIPLPFALGRFTFGPDGKALYAQAFIESPGVRPSPGIFKIEFNPTRVNPVLPGSAALGSANSLAVSKRQDKIVVSACGVLELDLAEGKARKVLEGPGCHYKTAELYLSLSPEGDQAVACHNHSLELIDLIHGSTKSLGEGFQEASWSPDGKWIAALEAGGQERTILIDTSDFTKRRTLANSNAQWSPDSRYLLAWRAHALCGPYFGTLETIDVETGKESVIESSRCKVSESTTGWISSEIKP